MTKIDRTKLTDLERAAWGAAFEHGLALRCGLAANGNAATDQRLFGRACLLTFDEPDVGNAKAAAAWADQVVESMRLAAPTEVA